MLIGVRYRCYTKFYLPAPVEIIARNMHLLVGFVFFRLGVASIQLDSFRCPDDYCSNGGECYYVTEYMSPVASVECQAGWFRDAHMLQNMCYKVIWNQSQSYDLAQEACKEINATLATWYQGVNQKSLAYQLNNLMNVIQITEADRQYLWTAFCQKLRGNKSEQCVKYKPPNYERHEYDEKQSQALPFCQKKPEISKTTLRKQCKCPGNWAGKHCETTERGTDYKDYFVCNKMSCPLNTVLHVRFSAFIHLTQSLSDCNQVSGIYNTTVLHNAQCYSPNSLTAVKYWCQGKSSCNITSKLKVKPNSSLIVPCNTSIPPMLLARTSCEKKLNNCQHLDNDSISIIADNTCWHFVRKELTWWGAQDFCNQHGGGLAFVPDENVTFIPNRVLEKLASMPFNIWIGGEHKSSTNVTVQAQDCPFLHVEPDNREITLRSVSHSDKLKCDFGGPAYPWVCSVSPTNGCPENTTLFAGTKCFKMMHEPTSNWGEALADCKKQKGELIYYDKTVKDELVNYLIETMKKRIWEFWIAGSSNDSRDPDKIPIQCSTGKVSNIKNFNYISTKDDKCNLSDTKSIALCVTPPILNDTVKFTTTATTPLSTVTFTKKDTTASIKGTTWTNGDITTPFRNISCEKTIFEDNRGKTIWSSINGGQTQTSSCPGINSKGEAKWFCNATVGEFYPPTGPDMSGCKAMEDIGSILNAGRPDDRATILLQHVQEKPLFGSDLSQVLIFVDEIRIQQNDVLINESVEAKYKTCLNFTTTVADIVDELLGPQNVNAWRDHTKETRANVSTNLLKSVDAAGFFLGTSMYNLSHFIRKEAVDILVANLSMGTDAVNKLNYDNEIPVSIPDEINSKVNGSVIAVFTRYRNLTVVLTGDLKELKHYKLNSEVIGVSIQSETKSFKFSNGFINLTIKHVQRVKLGTNTTCVFWNTETGLWDDFGCFSDKTNETHTVCYCNHLTNFAVIMDVHGALEYDSPHAVILTWITILGCSLSIICLSITCITFISFRSLWSLRSTIHCNLCICLIVAQLVLLVGLDRTEIKLFCAIVAGVLHFAWLSAFSWVALEGIHIYVLLVKVFDTAEQKTWLYYVTGYGLPALIVAISAAIKPSGYGTERYCWLSTQDGFIFSFAAPMLLVVLFNFVIFGLAMRAAASVKSQRNESMVGKTKLWIRRSASLIPLLGLSWIFGFMYANENAIIFAYFFAIFNSAQGLFIFIFHCIRNEKVQQVVTRFVIQQREKSTSNLFAKSRSNSCTVTSSVRTTTSSEEVGFSRGIRRSLVLHEERVKSRVPSRWKFKLRVTSNQITPDPRSDSETCQLKEGSFRRVSDISL